MKSKSLALTNPHLRNAENAKNARIRYIASSTAIETQQPIQKIEEKLNKLLTDIYHRVTLA